jgi:hypothetical protein
MKFSHEYISQVKTVDQHEDCVYSLAWSPAEAWMYCSLSYEGR